MTKTKAKPYSTFAFLERMRNAKDGPVFLDPIVARVELDVEIEFLDDGKPKGFFSIFAKRPEPLTTQRLDMGEIADKLECKTGGHRKVSIMILEQKEHLFVGGKETHFLVGYHLDFAFGWNPREIEKFAPVRFVQAARSHIGFQGNMILVRASVREYDDGRPTTRAYHPIGLNSVDVERMFGLL